MDARNDIQESITETTHPGMVHPSFSITRQKILNLTSVYEPIPQTYMVGGEIDHNQPLPLMIVDETALPPILATPRQDATSAQATSEGVQVTAQVENPIVCGKRRRPKYSSTGSMFKKHAVLKRSATGPLDKDKPPYKWWCRVCKTELSLMSLGSLELKSHYRSESHLVKEHRIRMEVPGMALFDEDEQELLGISLQEAKKKTKDTYPSSLVFLIIIF